MLELSSNKIKVLGVFGRLSEAQEAYFDSLEAKYSQKPDNDSEYNIFRHLTLTFMPEATVNDIADHLDLLRDLKQFLPLKINIKRFFVKDEESLPGAQHIAAEFDLSQTEDIVQLAKGKFGDKSVATWYIKLVWFIPDYHQVSVMNDLASIKELEFTDFYLVSNKQNEDNTLYTSNRYKL